MCTGLIHGDNRCIQITGVEQAGKETLKAFLHTLKPTEGSLLTCELVVHIDDRVFGIILQDSANILGAKGCKVVVPRSLHRSVMHDDMLASDLSITVEEESISGALVATCSCRPYQKDLACNIGISLDHMLDGSCQVASVMQ